MKSIKKGRWTPSQKCCANVVETPTVLELGRLKSLSDKTDSPQSLWSKTEAKSMLPLCLANTLLFTWMRFENFDHVSHNSASIQQTASVSFCSPACVVWTYDKPKLSIDCISLMPPPPTPLNNSPCRLTLLSRHRNRKITPSPEKLPGELIAYTIGLILWPKNVVLQRFDLNFALSEVKRWHWTPPPQRWCSKKKKTLAGELITEIQYLLSGA